MACTGHTRGHRDIAHLGGKCGAIGTERSFEHGNKPSRHGLLALGDHSSLLPGRHVASEQTATHGEQIQGANLDRQHGGYLSERSVEVVGAKSGPDGCHGDGGIERRSRRCGAVLTVES